MKKIVLCIPTALAWMSLVSVSHALQAPSTLTQDQDSVLTSHHVSNTRELQAKKKCDPRQPSAYSPSNPIHTIQSPKPQQKPIRTAVWQDLRSHRPGATPPPSSIELHESELSSAAGRGYQTTVPRRPIIVEAQGWTRDKQGRVYLTSRFSRLRKQSSTPSDDGC